MQKLIAILVAAMFAGVTVSAVAADTSNQTKTPNSGMEKTPAPRVKSDKPKEKSAKKKRDTSNQTAQPNSGMEKTPATREKK